MYLISAVLGPDIPFTIANVSLRIEDAVIILMALFAFPLLATKRRPVHINKPIVAGLFGLILICLTSGTYNAIRGDFFDVLPFVKEIIRLVKYAAVYLIFLLVEKKNQPLLIRLFILASIASVGIQLLQFWDFFNINNWLAQHYGHEIRYQEVASSSYRDIGMWSGGSTFANKNVYGNFLLIPFAYTFGAFLNALSKNPGHSNQRLPLWSGAASMLFFTGILLTQSRTTLIAVTILIITMLYLSRRMFFQGSRYRVSTLMVIAVGVVVTIVIINYFNLKYIVNIADGFRVESSGELGSITFKVRQFQKVVSYGLAKNPVLGLSPGAEHLLVDFEYGYLLYWYGLVGLLGYFAFVISIIRSLFLYNRDIDAIILISIIISFLIFGLAATSFLNNRVFPIFLALLAMFLSQRQMAVVVPAKVRKTCFNLPENPDL